MSDDLDPDGVPKTKERIPLMPEVNLENYDPLQDLHYTRAVRGVVLKSLAGEGLPRDPRALAVVLATLKDIDGSALNQMKIKSDEKGQDLQSQHSAMVRAFLAEAGGFKAPLRAVAEVLTLPPVLSDDVTTREFVPGELVQGTVDQTYDEFITRTGELKLADVDAPD